MNGKLQYRLRLLEPSDESNLSQAVLWLDEGTKTIGRNKSDVDLHIDLSKHRALISRLHARITWVSNHLKQGYELHDTSLNGTYVNNFRVSGSALLKEGDEITFGHLKGATIEPGRYAPQSKVLSRFLFEMVEKSHGSDVRSGKLGTQGKLYPSTPTAKLLPSSVTTPSCLLSPPLTPEIKYPSTVLKDKTQFTEKLSQNRDGRKIEDNKEKLHKENEMPDLLDFIQRGERCDSQDCDLMSLVAKISDSVMNKEDEEEDSFNVECAINSCTPGTSIDGDVALRGKSAKDRDTPSAASPQETLKTASFEIGTVQETQEEPSSSSKGHRSSRWRQSSRLRKRRQSYIHETCSNIDCCHPGDDVLTWVQCDDCKKWYHLKCVGLSDKEAKRKRTSYNCGC